MLRSEVNQSVVDLFPNGSYLEIGVSEGVTFDKVIATRKVAVDPAFAFDLPAATAAAAGTRCSYFQMPSDEFFSRHVGEEKFDVVFIAGLHEFHQVFRDFVNAIACLAPGGVVIVDDVLPTSFSSSVSDFNRFLSFQAARNDPDRTWMGDVYKLVYMIRDYFPVFHYSVVEENHGQMIVWRREKNRDVVNPLPVARICQLDFADISMDKGTFKIRKFQDILADVKSSRR